MTLSAAEDDDGAIEATAETIEAQKQAFFELMPSEKLPEVSLDLRAFASRSEDHVQAKVLARQEGTVPKWTDIGAIACEDASQFSQAVAKQRALIARWAYLVCIDFETGELLVDTDGAPIELQWYTQTTPSAVEAIFQGKKPQQTVESVPPTLPFPAELRCGFLGRPGIERRGGGVTARYDKVVWPEGGVDGRAF